MKSFIGPVTAALLAVFLSAPGGELAAAKSSGGSGGSGSSSHYYGSRSSSSKGSSSKSSSKSLPPGTRFIKRECKTASCKAKHPSGEYYVPIKPKN